MLAHVLAAVAVAVAFHRLGAMAVWLSVLSLALKVVLACLALAAVAAGLLNLRRCLTGSGRG